MHIKTIVLDNFKSFGQKTRIPLYEDFTTISGPNGSGKSNIIDAILFALGLARTRGIRAQKLTDLIYNPGYESDGTTQLPREASVEVILDNSDATLSRSQVVSAAGSEKIGDVDEISIRRRIKETEDNYYSYYYLNDRSVNLSDIQDLLAAAGVTPEGYNVVMQGDVTEIINMTPGERREIIDEIAGVAEFDAKKEDAFEELETVEDRIREAETRIETKEEQLDQLEDEREQALEYQSLREEKETYEGYLKAAELADKREQQQAVQDDIDDLEATLAERQTTLDKHRGRVTRLEEDLEDLNAEIQRKGEEEQLELQREIEATKADIGRLEDQIEQAEERIEDAESRRREAFVKRDRKQEQLEEINTTIRETKVEKSSVAAELKDRKADLADVKAEIEQVDTEYEELKDRLQSLKDERESLKSEKNDLQREKDRLLDEARRRSTELENTKEELSDLQDRQDELETELADLETELDKATANQESIEDVIADLKEQKQDLEDDLQNLEETIQQKQQEYAEVEARAEQHGGDDSYGRAVTAVLDADFDGVHGAVGQLGTVDKQYATACETAAGSRLANVVVDDDGVGQQCIEYLKSRNAGRATFLPLTEMDQRRLPSLPRDPGIIDFAYNLVEFDSQYAGVFSYVLGDTVVVEDIDTARAYMGDYRFVTLEGELVEKSGAMTGGSTSGTRYSFSTSGDGKLDRLAAEITSLQDDQADLKDRISNVEEKLTNAREKRADAVEAVTAIENDIEDIEEKQQQVTEEIAATEDRIAELTSKRDEVDDRMQDIQSEIDDHDERIDDLTAEIEDVEAQLESSRIPELTAQADEIREDIDALQSRIDDLDGKLNEAQLEKEYLNDAIEDLDAEVEDAQEEIADQRERIQEYRDQIEDNEETLEQKQAAVAELEDELTELKAQREELKADLQDAKADRDEAREAVREVEADLEDRRETADRLAWEIEQLEAEVDDYDPDTVPPHDEVTAEIERLEEAMADLEPVNMLAIEEYDTVESELEELQDGKATLVEERDGIEARIEQYEAEKRDAFMTAFEAIDAHFQEIFERLSSGTGELILENEADPFDGGLTMEAEPADKPVQRLEAMSGGEKSLTALSFIFAIQRYDPAPFYALDEIDAFLDAANAERVGEMVDELAGDAQFVVVSHRSAMLDRSERAIGVTMQNDNVSAVTGIDLAEG